ncbi:S41 family peptidase [Bacillus sp. FJAT-27245]|uniref:S41 family peptidase n=1 Tax=Bacillus sp. FJAT-27245 TaxID=1684144 RepID=UPI0006A79ABE|nr:S41 family peptidase [Bacillus sp. FJAT-27245]
MTGRKKWVFLSAGIAIILLFIGFNLPFQESGKSTSKPEVTKPTERTVQNVRAFAKLFGYVYYFHPSDEAFELDWEKFSLYGLQQVMNASSDKELKEKLEELFLPVAPTLQIYLEDEQQPEKQVLKKGDKLIAWQHFGMNMNNDDFLGYKSERIISDSNGEIKLFDQTLKAGTFVDKNLSPGLNARLPLVLYHNGKETLGGTKEGRKKYKKYEKMLDSIDYDEKTMYIANTILTWNAYQHFYPYFDVVQVDWEDELDKALGGINTEDKPEDWESSFRLMLAATGDAHNTGTGFHSMKNGFLRLRLEWIEDQLIVIQSEYENVKAGDRVIGVNGVETNAYLREAEAKIPGSPQWKRYKAIEGIYTSDSFEKEVTLTLSRDGGELSPISLKYDGFLIDEFDRESYEPIHEIEKGIYYIDLNRAYSEFINEYIEKLTSAKGVIFDYRGYPEDFQLSVSLISHLIGSTVKTPKILIPQNVYPDQEKVDFQDVQWPIEPASPKFSGKMVFLTYAKTLSRPELFLDIVKEYKLGEIVGQASGGNNGSIIRIELVDTYSPVHFTGGKVLKQDGSQHHLIGVEPTVTVTRTIRAVKEGRDEYIEKALELINR